GLVVCIEQRIDLCAQLRIVGARLVQIPGSLVLAEHAGSREDILHALPAIGGQAPAPAMISRCSHARAIAHSRFTVAGETPMTSAVSLMLRPPKKRSSTSVPCGGCSAPR